MIYNVAYASDQNYAKHVGISLISLLENNKNLENIHIYIIEDNISEELKEKLVSIVNRYKRELTFLKCNKLCENLDVKVNFPKAAFSRLFLDKIDEIDKILYLDSDTIINSSIKELYETNIDDYYVAGVQDNAAYYLLKKIGMNKNDRYINSGVLLMNLKKWREDNVEEMIVDFIKKHNGKVNHHDQGIINGVCKKKILIINPKYNMMPEMIYLTVKQSNFLYNVHNYYSQKEIDSAVNEPVVIHYIEKFYSRPWKCDCTHPLKDKYLNILNSSEFDKELDKNGMNKHVLLRKKVYDKYPFLIYVLFEKTLDIRRKFL